MCKGLSGIANKHGIYWTPKSNRHEVIKETHRLTDTLDLAPFEVYPMGKSCFSANRADWEIVWENKPSWFVHPEDERKVMKWLVEVVQPEWGANGIAEMRLDDLGYVDLPQDMLNIVRTLDCSNNELTTLEAPLAITLDCFNNKLTN